METAGGMTYVSAPLYQHLVDWFREKQIKIIESPQAGYKIYLSVNDKYFKHCWCDDINNAITEAFKLI